MAARSMQLCPAWALLFLVETPQVVVSLLLAVVPAHCPEAVPPLCRQRHDCPPHRPCERGRRLGLCLWQGQVRLQEVIALVHLHLFRALQPAVTGTKVQPVEVGLQVQGGQVARGRQSGVYRPEEQLGWVHLVVGLLLQSPEHKALGLPLVALAISLVQGEQPVQARVTAAGLAAAVVQARARQGVQGLEQAQVGPNAQEQLVTRVLLPMTRRMMLLTSPPYCLGVGAVVGVEDKH